MDASIVLVYYTHSRGDLEMNITRGRVASGPIEANGADLIPEEGVTVLY